MRASLLFGGALAAGASLTGIAAAQPREATERSYPVAGFDKVIGAGANHFLVTVGEAPSVRASGPAATLDKFEVVVEDRELRIRPKDRYRHDGSLRDLASATYRITLPRIRAATLAGSGDMAVDRVDGRRFSAVLAGSGKLSIERMAVDEANLTLAGSGDLSARGRARSSNVSVAGSGRVRARGLRSESGSVAIAGSGDTALTVSGQAQISIVGSGDVAIAGTRQCSVSKMGSGTATCTG